ncbi:MAG: hypothetical protein L7F78_08900, partial [Syntrophales bacterium LBB04]|nr:hypothetical protein [Syntrophales bacterium LBB04]
AVRGGLDILDRIGQVLSGSFIRNGKLFRVFSIYLEQLEKLAFLDAKERLGSASIYLFVEISL